ncbi:MAG TPA: RDD family protein [Terriglobales bacterium]|nr:RDD family protein [Terriglobales bacterium]
MRDLTGSETRTACLDPLNDPYSYLSRGEYHVPETMPAVDPQSDQWRDEVSSRVQNYRRRRSRNSGDEYSLRLDFNEPAQPSVAQAAIAHVTAERPIDPDVSCDINYFRRTNAATAPVYESEPDTYAPEPEFDPDYFTISDALIEAPSSATPSLDGAMTHSHDSSISVDPQSALAAQPEQISLDDARWGFDPEETVAASEDPESGNLIVFPTQPTYQVPTVAYELGEPVLERPRILDVPEDVLPTIQGPLFPEIQLDFEKEDVADPNRPSIDVPLQVAMINQRVFGGIVDAAMVLCGFGAFSAAFFEIVSNVIYTKAAIAIAFAIPAILWMAYHYLFLTYAGRTPGMIMSHLYLVNFEGGEPNQHRRRQRAISMIVSLISGGVGFGWAFLDPDTLCWHDSISRTYLTQER